MIRAVHIARYRGIRELATNGFGRVNLIIGKNDCGKTAFMEALRLAEDGEDAAHHLLNDQRARLSRATRRHDFERFWRPIFFNLDARTGLVISVTRDDSARKTLEVRQGTISAEIISDHSDDLYTRDRDEEEYEGKEAVKPPRGTSNCSSLLMIERRRSSELSRPPRVSSSRPFRARTRVRGLLPALGLGRMRSDTFQR